MKFLSGLILGLLLVPLFLYFYLSMGLAPVATSAPQLPFEKRITSMALNARVAKEAPKDFPLQPTEENLTAGAHIYRTHCAVCHALPGQPQSAIAEGMFPKPPQLFKEKGVTDDTVGETYWKVANGIRLTGMPAFEQTLGKDKVWQVSLLLAGADKLPPSVQTILRQPVPDVK
jgi:mono/diheme cytochrome c family protein